MFSFVSNFDAHCACYGWKCLILFLMPSSPSTFLVLLHSVGHGALYTGKMNLNVWANCSSHFKEPAWLSLSLNKTPVCRMHFSSMFNWIFPADVWIFYLSIDGYWHTALQIYHHPFFSCQASTGASLAFGSHGNHIFCVCSTIALVFRNTPVLLKTSIFLCVWCGVVSVL